MTKHIERLMSRASVAAMAAFAPKPEPVSTVPAFAERVEDTPADGGDRGDTAIDGLTAEEQAQIDAMNAGRAPDDTGNADPAGDAGADGDADSDADGDGDADAVAAADGADPAPADGAERREPRTINYKRHQKEVARLQKAHDDLQAALDGARGETKKEREERLRLDERTRMLLEAINTKPPAAAAAPAADTDPEPDADADPIGHLQWKNRKLEQDVADLRGGAQRQQQETAAQAEERQILSTLDADIGRAIAADPTFADAFAHLRETRFQELGFIFADIDITDPAQCKTLTQAEQAALSQNIQRTFMNEQLLVAGQAIKSGRSPAQKIANLARSRGWKPGAAAPAAAPAPAAADPAPAPRGTVPAPRAAAPAPSVKDQLAAVRDNLDASRSLSDAGGSPGGNMTPQRIAEMSPEEFEAYYDSIPKAQFDRMMGKPANM